MIPESEFRKAMGVQLSIQDKRVIDLVRMVFQNQADLRKQRSEMRTIFGGSQAIELPGKRENPVKHLQRAIQFAENILSRHAKNEGLEKAPHFVQIAVYSALTQLAMNEVTRVRTDEDICQINSTFNEALARADLDRDFSHACGSAVFFQAATARQILQAIPDITP